jgi:hypothetical protein
MSFFMPRLLIVETMPGFDSYGINEQIACSRANEEFKYRGKRKIPEILWAIPVRRLDFC